MRKIDLNLYVENSAQETKAREVLTKVGGVADEDINTNYGCFGLKRLVVKRVAPKTYKKIMKALESTNEDVYVRF